MSQKNYGISGVGSDLQLGKSGPRLTANSNVVAIRSSSGSLAPIQAANAVSGNDLVTYSQLMNVAAMISTTSTGVADGYQLMLGNAATSGDGSFSPGAVTLTDTTTVSEAVDALNEVLAKLVPSAPPAFPNGGSLTVTSTGNHPRLASGASDSTGSTLTAGTSVTRIVTSVVSSANRIANVGPADTGIVTLTLNGANVAAIDVSDPANLGTVNGLQVTNLADYPANQPGFHKSIDIGVANATTSVGINSFRISHSAAGQTGSVVFVRDSLTSLPAITTGTLAEATPGVISFSSSVPHYGTNATVTIAASISNLAGQTYYGGSDPIQISGTNGILPTRTLTYADVGITTPIAANTTSPQAITPVTVAIDGTNVVGSGRIQMVAKNVVGSSPATDVASTSVLVMAGTQVGKVYEMAIPVSNIGTGYTGAAYRVSHDTGDIGLTTDPTDTPAAGFGAFDPTAPLSNYEAAVVGGVLKHDQTNYAIGYLPAGPNLSVGRSGPQYFTYAFQRSAVSNFRISVTGTYAGCWVKVPGISDTAISPNAPNGWWDAFQLYDGAGAPGEGDDSLAGCAFGAAMTGSSGSFLMTLGNQTTTNATDNMVYVRFKLLSGQSVTALSIGN